MADNFLEALQKSMQPPEPTVDSPSSQTEETANLLRTKATGKALSPSPSQPRASSLQEEAARQSSSLAKQKVAREAQLGARDIGQAGRALEEDASFAEADQEQNQLEAKSRLTAMAKKLIDSYEREGQGIDFGAKKAKAEQLGAALRLSNQSYIDNLQREGKKSRLNTSIGEKEALQRAIFKEEENLFEDDLNFRRALSADDRQFRELLSQIDLNSAIELAKNAQTAGTESARWSGIGQIVQGGVAAGTEYAKQAKDSPPPRK
jgi:hypothetical protein